MSEAFEEQPARVRRRRRRSGPRASSGDRRGRLRTVYFSVAALWGFLTGTGSILVGLSLVDTSFEPGALGLGLIATAAVLALIGGLISATAYRQASRRHR